MDGKPSFAIHTPQTNTTIEEDEAYIRSWKTKLLQIYNAGHELANHGLRHEPLSVYLKYHTRTEFLNDRVILFRIL